MNNLFLDITPGLKPLKKKLFNEIIMDYNSKINWMQGMELTQQTFRQLEDSLDFRQQLVLKTALGTHQLGLIPGSVFHCNGNFVNSKFEIIALECRAVLPSGKIIDIHEDVTVKIPIL